MTDTRRHGGGGRLVRSVAVLVSLVALIVGTATARASSGDDADALARIDAHRARAERVHLTRRSDLDAAARRSVEEMIRRKSLGHFTDVGSETSGWSAIGEIVGRSSSGTRLVQLWLASAAHRHHIEGPYTEVGVHSARDDQGRLYMSVVFRRPEGVPASAADAPAPPPAPPPSPSPPPTSAPSSSAPLSSPAPTSPSRAASAPAPTPNHPGAPARGLPARTLAALTFTRGSD